MAVFVSTTIGLMVAVKTHASTELHFISGTGAAPLSIFCGSGLIRPVKESGSRFAMRRMTPAYRQLTRNVFPSFNHASIVPFGRHLNSMSWAN